MAKYSYQSVVELLDSIQQLFTMAQAKDAHVRESRAMGGDETARDSDSHHYYTVNESSFRHFIRALQQQVEERKEELHYS